MKKMPGLSSKPSNQPQRAVLEAGPKDEEKKMKVGEPKAFEQKQPRPHHKQKKAGHHFGYNSNQRRGRNQANYQQQMGPSEGAQMNYNVTYGMQPQPLPQPYPPQFTDTYDQHMLPPTYGYTPSHQ